MPDGRTAPNTTSDWKFANFELTQKNLQRGGSVDVTYTGPGLASMEFTAFIKASYEGPFGPTTDTFEMQGYVTAIRADATDTVTLLGGGQADSFHQDATFDPAFTVTKVSDDDPKARAD